MYTIMEQVHEVLIITSLEIIQFFGVDNTSSCHTDNRNNVFLVLREGPTYYINGSFGSLENSSILTLAKRAQDFV